MAEKVEVRDFIAERRENNLRRKKADVVKLIADSFIGAVSLALLIYSANKLTVEAFASSKAGTYPVALWKTPRFDQQLERL
jgi:hypothetical protein